MITSERKFGVEIEFTVKTSKDYERLSNVLPVVQDGSLRDAGVIGGEYVSPILNLKTGVKEIHRVCAELKKGGATGEHPATSIHVHLDGKKESALQISKNRNKDFLGTVVAISNRLSKLIGPEIVAWIVANRNPPNFVGTLVFRNTIDNVIYFSCADISRHPIINYTYYTQEPKDRFQWLQNMFYFYTIYSEVMENVVSKSRRFGNMYCVPLDKSFELQEIENCASLDNIRRLWYRNNEQGTHYDDSRYHNVNFHCYWHRLGTVEIRSHGGTIDPDKILLWVKLHQKIADKLETMTVNDIKFSGNMYESFINFVEEPILQEYVKRLLGYYSGISINK